MKSKFKSRRTDGDSCALVQLLGSYQIWIYITEMRAVGFFSCMQKYNSLEVISYVVNSRLFVGNGFRRAYSNS